MINSNLFKIAEKLADFSSETEYPKEGSSDFFILTDLLNTLSLEVRKAKRSDVMKRELLAKGIEDA